MIDREQLEETRDIPLLKMDIPVMDRAPVPKSAVSFRYIAGVVSDAQRPSFERQVLTSSVRRRFFPPAPNQCESGDLFYFSFSFGVLSGGGCQWGILENRGIERRDLCCKIPHC